MARYLVIIEVDEDQVLEASKASGVDNIEEAIERELGWAAGSGIAVESVEAT